MDTSSSSPAPTISSTASEIPPTNGLKYPQVNLASNVFLSTHDLDVSPFELSKEYAYTARELRVITIGAGFSGLMIAHKF
jgi:hypothetical protein